MMSLWLLSIGIRIIYTTNESVDQRRFLKSNALQNIEEADFVGKNSPQDRLFYETKCAAGKTCQKKCAVTQIFGLNTDG